MNEAAPNSLAETLAGARIGLATSWGRPVGRDKVAARLVEQLTAAGAEVCVLCEPQSGDETTPAVGSMTCDDGTSDCFESWVTEHRLQVVIFTEYQQWEDHGDSSRLRFLEGRGVLRIGYLVWERFFPERIEEYRHYDAVLASHPAFESLLQDHGLTTLPFRWGWGLPLPKPPLPESEPIELLHIAGTGGARGRKGTAVVADAFATLAGETDFRLRLCSQKPLPRELPAQVAVEIGNLPQQRIDAYLRGARVSVQPSRWEGLGLPLLESLTVGTPVITTGGPPMDSWIRHKREGLIVPSTEGTQEGIAVSTREVTAEALVETILLLRNRDLLQHLEKTALAGGTARSDLDDAALLLAAGIQEAQASLC